MAYKPLSKALNSTSSSAPVVSMYETALTEPPEKLLSDISGLMAVQPVRGPNGHLRFIAFWQSSDHAYASDPLVRSRLSSSAPFAGVALEPITPAKGHWARIKDHAVPILLTFVAVLGALDVLTDRYAGLLAEPQYTLRLDSRGYDIDEGGSVAPVVTVENALSNVELSNIVIRPTIAMVGGAASANEARVLDAQKTSLPATKSRSYQMLGERLPAGEGEVVVAVQAEGGLLRRTGEEKVKARLTVWPRAPEPAIKLTHVKQSENRADFLWTLKVGSIEEASTVTCDLTLIGGKFQFNSGYWRPIDGMSGEQWITAEDVAVLKVNWPAVRPRSRLSAEFSLVAAPGTDWKGIEKLKPTCSVRRKQ